jgi:hypothetical protein
MNAAKFKKTRGMWEKDGKQHTVEYCAEDRVGLCLVLDSCGSLTSVGSVTYSM